mmetsp:Transcript_19378/g.54011  ORF Transcript_19378/g.54011 Transcript_19378/m.54011 type:complete len:269 (+) Transcript_19378:2425-3231(+)
MDRQPVVVAAEDAARFRELRGMADAAAAVVVAAAVAAGSTAWDAGWVAAAGSCTARVAMSDAVAAGLVGSTAATAEKRKTAGRIVAVWTSTGVAIETKLAAAVVVVVVFALRIAGRAAPVVVVAAAEWSKVDGRIVVDERAVDADVVADAVEHAGTAASDWVPPEFPESRRFLPCCRWSSCLWTCSCCRDSSAVPFGWLFPRERAEELPQRVWEPGPEREEGLRLRLRPRCRIHPRTSRPSGGFPCCSPWWINGWMDGWTNGWMDGCF